MSGYNPIEMIGYSAPSHVGPTTSVLEMIGKTPLVRLQQVTQHLHGVEIYAKAEWQNPSGSVKDRPAARMILEAEKSGELTKGKIVLDATSGNTGIAYAMIAATRGYGVKLCIPANANAERKKMLLAYGAELVFTDPMEGADGAVREARRIHGSNPDLYFYPDQYNNDANWRAHYDTTGPEIVAQSEGRVTHFVAGIGTSGTFVGTGRRLREFKRDTRLIAVQPDLPLHGLEGLKHLASASVPGIYDPRLADEVMTVSTEEAYTMVRRLALEEGLLVGVSSGANVVAAIRTASRIASGVIVTILCDGGSRYLSERFWNEMPTGSRHSLMLPHNVVDEMRGHARQEYPNECCGALLGKERKVSVAIPLPNATDDGRRRRFLIRPEEYLRVEARAREQGEQLLGIYHSHPDHPARPSQYDLEHAWPNLDYVVVAVTDREIEGITAWRLDEMQRRFDEEDILIL